MIQLAIATVCAWCAQEQGLTPQEGQSHGICTSHRNKEREKYQASRGVRGLCGHIARDANSYCGNPRCSGWGW